MGKNQVDFNGDLGFKYEVHTNKMIPGFSHRPSVKKTGFSLILSGTQFSGMITRIIISFILYDPVSFLSTVSLRLPAMPEPATCHLRLKFRSRSHFPPISRKNRSRFHFPPHFPEKTPKVHFPSRKVEGVLLPIHIGSIFEPTLCHR